MAPSVKLSSFTGMIYEKNNWVVQVNKALPGTEDYHTMMDFITSSKLRYAMLAAATIQYEVVEEVWKSMEFQEKEMELTFSLKGKSYTCDTERLRNILRLPRSNADDMPSDDNVRKFLKDIAYVLSVDNLTLIKRKGMRKEWSFLSDCFIKAFSGKVSDFGSFSYRILQMFYMFMKNSYFNFAEEVMKEIGLKLLILHAILRIFLVLVIPSFGLELVRVLPAPQVEGPPIWFCRLVSLIYVRCLVVSVGCWKITFFDQI